MSSSLTTIAAEFGFDYGPEFEIVTCDVLRTVLPEKFGICRGFLTNSAGESAGDDVVIFDRYRFPTLQLRPISSYGRKEFVPVDAALCYIEAKHTIEISGKGDASLSKACLQVANVKKLAATRERVPPGTIAPFLNSNDILGGLATVRPSPYLPADISNPMFSMVFARQVRKTRRGKIFEDPDEIHQAMEGVDLPEEFAPDLIVLGEHNVIIPVIDDNGETRYASPFFLDGKSTYVAMRAREKAFGVALFSLLSALDWIRLGHMPWQTLITDALKPKPEDRLTPRSTGRKPRKRGSSG
jgi:hypothetical protein